MKTNTHAKPNPDNENGLTHGASRSDSVVDEAVLEFAHGKAVRCRAITLQMLETPDHSLKTRSCRSKATIGWTPTLRRPQVTGSRLTEMQAGSEPVFDNIKGYLKTDYTEDVTTFDVPVLIVHDDDGQIASIDVLARASSRAARDAVLKTFPGSPDRVAKTHCARLNTDLTDFVEV